MKKLTTIIFMLLISFCFVLTGCGTEPLTMPANYSNPVSNGGFIVGAGNYMYFANAYKSYSNLKEASDNEGENVAQYSLKRVELKTEYQNRTWFDIALNEEDKIKYENVTNKITGYETENMFVVKDYLYFTSPNVHKNKQNEHEFNLSTLFRIKLDGTGLKEIYTTKTATPKFYLEGEDEKNLLIYDDSKIMSVDVENNSTEVKTLVEDVTDVEFPNAQEQTIAWLYYTTNRDEESQFTGNILNKISLETEEIVENVSARAGETISIIAQDYGKLFYTKTGGTQDGLFSNDFSSGSNSEKLHRTLTEGISDKSTFMYIKCENSEKDAFMFIYKDNLYIQLMSATNDSQAQKITSGTTIIQFSAGSYVYYTVNSAIYRYSVIDRVEKQISDKANINTELMDFDGRYVYFFATLDKEEGEGDTEGAETSYLFRADAFATEEMKTECIAELAEEDIKEEDGETQE